MEDVEPLAARAATSVEPVGDPRREAEHAARRAARRRRAIATAPPIEKPSSSVRSAADGVDRRARVLDAQLEPLPRLDPVAHLARRRARGTAARAGRRATRATRSRCRRLRPLWPPFTHTTARAGARAGDAQLGAARELHRGAPRQRRAPPPRRDSVRSRSGGRRAASRAGGAASATRGRARGRAGPRRRAWLRRKTVSHAA